MYGVCLVWILIRFSISGYIGGSVVSKLLEHPRFPEFDVTVVVRSAEKAEKLKKLGLNVVVGSHSDKSLMENLSEQTDVVLAMAGTGCFVY